METKRINLSDRIVAFLLACTMIFTILPCPVINAEDVNYGIGIYNHILTKQSSTQTVYKIKLYRTQKTEVTPADEEEDEPAVYRYSYHEMFLPGEYALQTIDNKTVYLASDGELILEKNQMVNFIDDANSDFKNYLIKNQITRIVIDVQCHELRNGNNVKTYEQYTSQTGFSGEDADYDSDSATQYDPADNPENDKPSIEIYKFQYSEDEQHNTIILQEDNYVMKQFNLTPMVDYDAHVQWRDTNAERPELSSVMFDISRDDNEYISGIGAGQTPIADYGGVYAGTEPAETVQRTITEIDSNHVLYTYSVPECRENGQAYKYKATEKEISDYYIEPSEQNGYFTNYHLRDFHCTVKWDDHAHAADIEKHITSQFIIDHFELLDETVGGKLYNALKVSEQELEANDFPEETKRFIEKSGHYTTVAEDGVTYYVLKDNYIKYTSTEDGKGTIKIDGLLELTADGMAKTYSLKPKTTITEDNKEVINQIPVYEVAGTTAENAEFIQVRQPTVISRQRQIQVSVPIS